MMFLEQAQTVAELQDHYRKVRNRLSNSNHQQPLPAKKGSFSKGPYCNHHIHAWRYELLQRRIDKWKMLHCINISADNELENNWPKITMRKQSVMIVAEVAFVHGFDAIAIISNRRHKKLAAARFEAVWRVYRATDWSLPHIGQFFGNRDHTSIIHAIRSYEKRTFGADYKSHRLKPVIDHRAARAKGGAA